MWARSAVGLISPTQVSPMCNLRVPWRLVFTVHHRLSQVSFGQTPPAQMEQIQTMMAAPVLDMGFNVGVTELFFLFRISADSSTLYRL
jgi:hypothetical protein